MSSDDKMKHKAQETTGQAKEKLGKATNDDEMRAEGKADQSKGSAKQAGEKVKDVFK